MDAPPNGISYAMKVPSSRTERTSMTMQIGMLAIHLAKGSLPVCTVGAGWGECGRAWTPPDCNGLIGQGRRLPLRTQIRFAERPDVSSPQTPMDFSVSSSIPPRHRRLPCRSTLRFKKQWKRPFHHALPDYAETRLRSVKFGISPESYWASLLRFPAPSQPDPIQETGLAMFNGSGCR